MNEILNSDIQFQISSNKLGFFQIVRNNKKPTCKRITQKKRPSMMVGLLKLHKNSII